MDTAAKILCNGFPRTVAAAADGALAQTFVHSEGEFDVFFEHNKEDKNIYMNIARFRSDMRPITGDIAFDFDAPLKDSAFEEGTKDGEKIEMMREDGDLAEEILGAVWDDVQTLVSACWEREIPVISVFSGLGVHCHLLYQEQVNPTEEKTTTSYHFIEELDLKTHDVKIIPDTKRILRVPNSQRVDDGDKCGVWCIPMTELEVLNNNLHEMLERCKNPKSVEYYDRYKPENRPEMRVYEDVDVNADTAGTVPLETTLDVPNNVEYMVRSCISMPCVQERFLSPNPDHMIRFTGVAMLYQAGFQPAEVREIIRKIGWVDYDEQITRKMTDQIWNRGYSELSCNTLQTHGLCVYGPDFEEQSDDPKDCPTHNYTSGKVLYPYDK